MLCAFQHVHTISTCHFIQTEFDIVESIADRINWKDNFHLHIVLSKLSDQTLVFLMFVFTSTKDLNLRRRVVCILNLN